MAEITARAFIDGLEAMTVAGVNRTYTSGPPDGAPGTGDTPALYVWFQQGTDAPLVFGEQGGASRMIAQVVILVNAVGQKTGPENFDDCVDMLDALRTGIRALDCTVGKLEWTLSMGIRPLAGQDYWAVWADVTGGGWA